MKWITIGLALLSVQGAVAQMLPVNIQATDKVSTLNVIITRFGPSPKSVTLPSNAISLLVQNYSGVPNDTFSLRQQGASSDGTPPPLLASMLDLHSTVSQHRDHRTIQLAPGSYVLTFLAHPDWRVSITITSAVQQ
jgi:hypothetical protein